MTDKMINFCYHNNVVFTYLFEEERYTKTTETSDSQYVFTWIYYECPLCHQIVTVRKEEKEIINECVCCGEDFEEYTVRYCDMEIMSNLCTECIKVAIQDDGSP